MLDVFLCPRRRRRSTLLRALAHGFRIQRLEVHGREHERRERPTRREGINRLARIRKKHIGAVGRKRVGKLRIVKAGYREDARLLQLDDETDLVLVVLPSMEIVSTTSYAFSSTRRKRVLRSSWCLGFQGRRNTSGECGLSKDTSLR